ncbi:GIY-YIG nuclease family protein [Streptomyces sp. RM72]|uniref:GIY-YIG nuclease family protein n=1 Tax=Streptomyces sp. RM72 TaxID=1115510 RepID=UPI001B385545|nr:GIY-YIG nuclease family protein [Streptomyces sp. RM72]MBQ0883454.1 GIY-YIG nuclease family protein [Streptomyces sp. RM72]
MSDDSEQTAGYVYILVNSSVPDLVKIGLTRGTSKARASDLSRNTGVPTPFVVAYDELVADCIEVEKRLHEKFANQRVNGRREFFQVTSKEAIDALQKIARFSPFLDDEEVTRVNLLPAFDARCRRWLRRDLVGLSYLQTATTCALEMVRQESFALSDLKVDRVDLNFITDGDAPTFDPQRDPEENARVLLELDSYSLIMCFDFIDHDVAMWIDEEYRGCGRVPFTSRQPHYEWRGGSD